MGSTALVALAAFDALAALGRLRRALAIRDLLFSWEAKAGVFQPNGRNAKEIGRKDGGGIGAGEEIQEPSLPKKGRRCAVQQRRSSR